jgi:predicted enzyme related to lactoylglutathione lyase
LDVTRDFYSKLFGWKFEMLDDKYAAFKTPMKGLTGGFVLADTIKPGTTRFYVSVSNIPKTQREAVHLGGKVGQRKKAIGRGTGYWATIKDPHGNIVGIWSRK